MTLLRWFIDQVESMVALVLVDHLMQHQAQCALFPRDFSFPTVSETVTSSTEDVSTTTTAKAVEKGEK